MKTDWVEGEGPIPSDTMFVGEAPSYEEVKKGRPFVGKTGTEFDGLLRRVGVSRRRVRITNAFKYPLDDRSKKNAEEWEMMRDLLLEEVEECEPKVIVAMGAMATRMLVGVSVEAANGVPHELKGICDHPVVVIPTIHPAAPFHDPNKASWVTEAFEVVEGWTRYRRLPPTVVPREPEFDVCEVGKVLSGRSTEIGGRRCIGIDTETYVGDSEDGAHLNDDIYMVSVATGDGNKGYKAGLVNVERGGERDLEKIREWVDRDDVVVVMHNALFDLRILRQVGIVPRHFIDTMQLAFLLQNLPLGLKALAYRLRGWKMSEYKDVVGEYKDLSEARKKGKRREVDTYAMMDPVATLAVLEGLLRRSYPGVGDVLQRDMDIMPIIMAMEDRGMKLDVGFLQDVGGELVSRNMDLLEDIRKEAGVPDLNPASPKQMNEVLYGKLRLGKGKRIKETVWGKSTGKDALKVMKGEHPIIKMIDDWRETNTLIDKYVNKLPTYVREDGRIHTTISMTRVQHSGRLASSKPNLMAQPVRTEDGRRIREAFVAEDGYVILSADYSQIEMIVMAHLSRDPAMIKAYRNGKDIHTETAARIFGIKESEVDEIKHRYPAKRTGFGIINHIGPKGLARELADGGAGNWDEDACREMLEAWFRVYKGVKRFMDETDREMRRTGQVVDMWGRRYVGHNVWSEFEYKRSEAVRVGGSALISGGAQGIIKVAMKNVWEWMKRDRVIEKGIAYPLIQIHDDLTFEVREDKVKVVGKKIKRIMEGSTSLLLPTPVEVKVGKRWGKQEKYKV